MFRWIASVILVGAQCLLIPIELGLSVIAKLLLLSIGWCLLDHETTQRLRRKRVISTISHTSYWDVIIVTIYRLAYPNICRHIYYITKPQAFRYFGTLLRRYNFIPATKSENRGEGFVSTIIEHLRGKEIFHLVISPEGMMNANPWRSGYYHIAKGLDCPIQVLGFDYEKKRLYIGPNIYHPSRGLEDVQTELMGEMVNVVPLYPECSYTKVREHDKDNIGVIDWLILSNVITTFIPLYMIWRFDITCFIVGISSVITSLIYHSLKESIRYDTPCGVCINIKRLDWFFIWLTIVVYTWTLYQRERLVVSPYFMGALLMTIGCYYKASGRHQTSDRTRNYIVYHSLFHVGVGLCMMIPLV